MKVRPSVMTTSTSRADNANKVGRRLGCVGVEIEVEVEVVVLLLVVDVDADVDVEVDVDVDVDVDEDAEVEVDALAAVDVGNVNVDVIGAEDAVTRGDGDVGVDDMIGFGSTGDRGISDVGECN